MKNRLTVLVGLIVVASLLCYMFAYQVRYDEVVVLTTFDKATEVSIQREPGLRFRMPWPIQKVYSYSTRLQLLESELHQLSIRDGSSVVVKTYLAWRIEDPLKFYSSLQTIGGAEKLLEAKLNEQIGSTLGTYSFDDLVNLDPQKVKLAEIEQRVLEGLQQRLVREGGYGMAVLNVGVRRLALPEQNTTAVFESMRKTRERMAADARSSGQAQAAAIRSEANSARDRILAFASRRAEEIRAQGLKEAAQYYRAFQQDEELAITLRRIETLKKVLSNRTTFVLDAEELSAREILGSEQSNPDRK